VQQKTPRPRIRDVKVADDGGPIKESTPKQRQKPNRMMFTDLALRRLKPPPKGQQIVVWDTVQPGLTCLISSGGAKTFRSQFKLHGKHPMRSIGRLQENTTEEGLDVSVRAARERCRADRALAAEGKDPRAEANSPGKITVKVAIDRFINERCKIKQRTWDQTQAVLLRSCADWLDRPLVSITRGDLRDLLNAMIAKGHHASAKQTLAWVKTMWRWLAEIEVLEHDTMAPVKIDVVQGRRDRTFTDEELATIWKASGKLRRTEAAYVRLMILLAPRKTALALMKWDDLDNDLTLWTTPVELVKQTKLARPRTYKTPLPDLAQRILSRMPRSKDERVFPSISFY
jgi:hypothetical protein